MDEGPRRTRSHNQQQVARRQWRRLFFDASEWKGDSKAARQSEVLGRTMAKGRTRLDRCSRRSRLPVRCSTWERHFGRHSSLQRGQLAVGKKLSTAGTAIVGGDGGSYTSDESPRRSREVANPHTWPVCAKIAKIRRGEREPTQNSALGVGYQPTQTNAGDWRDPGAKPAGLDEEDTAIFYGDEAVRSSACLLYTSPSPRD